MKFLDKTGLQKVINWVKSKFVTALGTSGNYLTWTRNNTTNNITIPYSTNSGTASKLGSSTVGSSVRPIYLSGGSPNQVSSIQTTLLSEPSVASVSPTTQSLVTTMAGNKLVLLPASQIIIETTTDGGATWASANVSDDAKATMFRGTVAQSGVYIPLINGAKNKLCGLRITFTAMRYNVPANTAETDKYTYWNSSYVQSTERYTTLNGLYLWVSAVNCVIRTTVYAATGANPNNWVQMSNTADVNMTGWSGGNFIPCNNQTFGGATSQTGNYWNYRIVCFTDVSGGGEFPSTYTSSAQVIYRVAGYGPNTWTVPNNLFGIDHLYTWDNSANAIFPANVTSTAFVKSGGTSSQFLKADGSVDSNTYVKLSDTITTEFYKEVSGYNIP